jgi:hypothetical protein
MLDFLELPLYNSKYSSVMLIYDSALKFKKLNIIHI